MILTSKQEQVLNGLLLGDVCLFVGKSNKYPLLTVGRAAKDIEYLKYQADIFANLCSNEGIISSNKYDKKRDKTYLGFKFRTRSLEVFSPYYKLWYPEKKKIIPSNLELTPITMAHWFCDDGCIRTKKKLYKKSNSLTLKLSTNSFTKNDVEFLHSLLTKKYGNFFHIKKDSLEWYKKINPTYKAGDNNYFILTYTEGAWNIFHDIENVFPHGMERKLNVWKNVSEPDVFNKSSIEISKIRIGQIINFIKSHNSFTALDVAQNLDWWVNTFKYGKVPSSAIFRHLNQLVEEKVIFKSSIKINKSYIYKVV